METLCIHYEAALTLSTSEGLDAESSHAIRHYHLQCSHQWVRGFLLAHCLKHVPEKTPNLGRLVYIILSILVEMDWKGHKPSHSLKHNLTRDTFIKGKGAAICDTNSTTVLCILWFHVGGVRMLVFFSCFFGGASSPGRSFLGDSVDLFTGGCGPSQKGLFVRHFCRTDL